MTAKFWDKQAKKYDDLIQKHNAVYNKTLANAKSVLSTSDVVLDLGCASGEYSFDIAPFVRSVHGIDISTNMITLATKKASSSSIGNVTFDMTDVFDRSLDEHHYTAVFAFSVLHLVEDIHSVLRRVNDLLPTGGLFISETPCMGERSFLFNLFIRLSQKMNVMPPILSLTILELKAKIAGSGFDITESDIWDRKNAVHWIIARKR